MAKNKKENTTTGEAYETASQAIGFTKKAKVLIEIHQNTKLKGQQFHVVYNGKNTKDTSSSEKLSGIPQCKTNIKSHAYIFSDKPTKKKSDLVDVANANQLLRGINVNVYKDKVLQKTIIVNY